MIVGCGLLFSAVADCSLSFSEVFYTSLALCSVFLRTSHNQLASIFTLPILASIWTVGVSLRLDVDRLARVLSEGTLAFV